jgi:hypothetical protein
MTGFVPVMWLTWGALVVVMIGIKMYIGRLSKYEENQLILDDAFSNLKTEQAAIAEKVGKMQPVGTVTLWLVIAATLFVVGYYVLDVVKQFS